jgi:hypothetical protein
MITSSSAAAATTTTTTTTTTNYYYYYYYYYSSNITSLLRLFPSGDYAVAQIEARGGRCILYAPDYFLLHTSLELIRKNR